MNNLHNYKFIFKPICLCILTVCFVWSVEAYDVTHLKPVFDYDKDVLAPGGSPKALLFVSYDQRRDIVIIKEFVSICNDYANVSCLCVDKSNTQQHLLQAYAEDIGDSCYVYQEKQDNSAIDPYVIFLNRDNSLYEKVFYSSDFEPKLKSYLGFLNGDYDEETLKENLEAIEKAGDKDRIVPRLNFVVMLAKKGKREAALKELDKITVDNNTLENDVLLVAQVYLRLEAPRKALQVLKYCEGDECEFYKGVSYYLLEDFDKAEEIFENIGTNGELKERVDFYLSKIKNIKGAPDNEKN